VTDLQVQVRGGAATAEELAAIVAALQVQRTRQPDTRRFEQWRRQRVAALRGNRAVR